jgi:periplasmic divalent cation tolerance protein
VSELLLVMTTVSSQSDAEALARDMVGQRLAACAQIQAIRSIYRWQGEVCDEPECRVLFKTTVARGASLQDALRQRHPYELPAIVCLPAQSSAAFGDWVAEACAPA